MIGNAKTVVSTRRNSLSRQRDRTTSMKPTLTLLTAVLLAPNNRSGVEPTFHELRRIPRLLEKRPYYGTGWANTSTANGEPVGIQYYWAAQTRASAIAKTCRSICTVWSSA
jgi:hypothetical protein